MIEYSDRQKYRESRSDKYRIPFPNMLLEIHTSYKVRVSFTDMLQDARAIYAVTSGTLHDLVAYSNCLRIRDRWQEEDRDFSLIVYEQYDQIASWDRSSVNNSDRLR